MQRSIQLTRHHPAASRNSYAPSSFFTNPRLLRRQPRQPALAYHPFRSIVSIERVSSTQEAPCLWYCRPRTTCCTICSIQGCSSSRWRKVGRLGQARSLGIPLPNKTQDVGRRVESNTNWPLDDTYEALQPNDLESWNKFFASSQMDHGSDGVWECFQLMRQHDQTHHLVQQLAGDLRKRILVAAVSIDERVTLLVAEAQSMRQLFEFEWPELYVQLICSLLKRAEHDRAVLWHLRLFQLFPPDSESFGGLIANFVLDPSQSMQTALTTLYVFSWERRLYDCIIPVLFDNGQSKLARSWRKKLVRLQDFPLSAKSRPFLSFVSQYYPKIRLVAEEMDVMRDDRARDESTTEVQEQETHHDNLIAKWFATSWMSVEFAINLVHGLGVQMIGPRSLQSIALREPESKSVTAWLDHLERINLKVSPRAYCKALSFFARHGEDELLTALLHCDVHPQEFDDAQTRHMLLTRAIEQKDYASEKLFQGVELVLSDSATPHRLNLLLSDMLKRSRLSKVKVILDRMYALNVSITQDNASILLLRALLRLGRHPSRRREKYGRQRARFILDTAVYFLRRVAFQNIAIPIRYWRLLIYNLGRTGRLEELRQLSLEIVRKYHHSNGRLISVHSEDLPCHDPQPNTRMAGPPQSPSTPRIPGSPEFGQPSDPDGRHNNFLKTTPNSDPSRPSKEKNGPTLFRKRDCSDTFTKHSERGTMKKKGDQAGQPRQNTKHQYLPADLPFEHPEHPLRKLFDPALQRAIIRWGFDRTLRTAPARDSLMDTTATSLAEADLAGGVQLLGSLRDEGVWIDPQIVRSSITSRMALGQLPGRRRNRSRDSNELSARNLKAMADKAWGSEVLPSIPDIQADIERQRPRMWKRYPLLLEKAFDASQST